MQMKKDNIILKKALQLRFLCAILLTAHFMKTTNGGIYKWQSAVFAARALSSDRAFPIHIAEPTAHGSRTSERSRLWSTELTRP